MIMIMIVIIIVIIIFNFHYHYLEKTSFEKENTKCTTVAVAKGCTSCGMN